MATGPQAFYCLWQKDAIREKLFEYLSKEDICKVRLANSACCNLVTKRLFLRTHLTFSSHTFTRQSRIQALLRIGHHIEHLTFYFPHSDATFLPPLIHPETGQEISFLYTPHTSMASVLTRPKFANSGLGQILTEQYPPLFHAASNVPSFINAMKHVPNLRHLTIKTPGQDAKERYRRDIVDYALISLRISLERTPLKKLSKLSLSSVHPSAFIYLRHVTGFGCSPAAARRWKQIRKLYISAESWDFYGPSPGLDHLKMMDDFIRSFADHLEKLTFTWHGRQRGPCPVSLAADPLFAPPRSSRKLFHEVTSPMSPLPPAPARGPVQFRRLRYLAVRNATMGAAQVAELVEDHRHCVREFDFDNVVLIGGGTWDDALAPLMDNPSRSDHWSRHSTATVDENHDVGGVQTPRGSSRRVGTAPSLLSSSSFDHDDVPSPSAAVAAVSQELFEMELNGGGEGYYPYGEEEEQTHREDETDPDLPSDLEAARKASFTFSTKLKKRRVTKRRRRRKHGHEEEYEESPSVTTPTKSSRSRHHRRHRHKDSNESFDVAETKPSVGELYRPPTEPPHPQHYRSRSLLFGELDRTPSQSSSTRLFGEVAESTHSPSQSSSPRLLGEVEPELSHSRTNSSVADDDDVFFRPGTPVDDDDVFVDNDAAGMKISAPILNAQPCCSVLLQPTVYDPTADLCHEITAVQRDIEAEEQQRRLAEDADLRMSALRKAKEVVLSKLSEQFYGGRGVGVGVNNSSSGGGGGGGNLKGRKEPSVGVRFREGLFGPRRAGGQGGLDHRSMDVPILFSRG